MRDTVTIFVPDGYASPADFLNDCGFESLSVGPENVAAFNDGYAAGLEDRDEKLPRSAAMTEREAIARILDPRPNGPAGWALNAADLALNHAAPTTSPNPVVAENATTETSIPDWKQDQAETSRLPRNREASPEPDAVRVDDVRWGVNVLLETIAKQFEAWDTMDLWRSQAADLVRSHKHITKPEIEAAMAAASRKQCAPPQPDTEKTWFTKVYGDWTDPFCDIRAMWQEDECPSWPQVAGAIEDLCRRAYPDQGSKAQ